MIDEPSFPSPRRRTKPPARPAGLDNLSPGQETKAKIAEALYSRARREGWTRARFYHEITTRPRYKNLKQEIRDNLIDSYTSPKVENLRKRVPLGWTTRSTLQENAIEILHYAHVELEDKGGLSSNQWVIIEEDGGYRIYVPPRSP